MKLRKTDIKICDNVYYNEKNDTCIVIYKDYLVFYSDRIEGTTGRLPFSFKKSVFFERFDEK